MSRRNRDRDDRPVRVVHYPSPPRTTLLLTPAQLRQQQARQRAEYAAWAVRMNAIAEQDRRARHRAAGFGAVLALGVLVVLGVGGWYLLHVLNDLAAGGSVTAAPDNALVKLVLTVAGLGGGGLVTIRTCRHRD